MGGWRLKGWSQWWFENDLTLWIIYKILHWSWDDRSAGLLAHLPCYCCWSCWWPPPPPPAESDAGNSFVLNHSASMSFIFQMNYVSHPFGHILNKRGLCRLPMGSAIVIFVNDSVWRMTNTLLSLGGYSRSEPTRHNQGQSSRQRRKLLGSRESHWWVRHPSYVINYEYGYTISSAMSISSPLAQDVNKYMVKLSGWGKCTHPSVIR